MLHQQPISGLNEFQDFFETDAYELSNKMKLSDFIGSLKITEIYQRQYLQNNELLKITYKKELSSVLTKEQLKTHHLLQFNYEICNELM